MNTEIVLLTVLVFGIIFLILFVCMALALDITKIKASVITNKELKDQIKQLYTQIDDIKKTNDKAFLENKTKAKTNIL